MPRPPAADTCPYRRRLARCIHPRVRVPAAVAAAAGHAAVPRTAGFGIGREADQRGAGLPVVRAGGRVAGRADRAGLRHTFGVAAGQGTIRAVRLEARGWSADAQRYLPAHGARRRLGRCH